MRSSTRSTGRQRARSPGTSSAPTCNWSMPRKKIPTSAPERYAKNHNHMRLLIQYLSFSCCFRQKLC